jgi:hypothetical protein
MPAVEVVLMSLLRSILLFLARLTLFGWTTLASSAQGQPDLFVAPEGNDTAIGTSLEAPLRSLTEAIARVRRAGGGTIRVLGGTYNAEVETFPLRPAARTRIEAFDLADRPLISGTRQASIFRIEDIPGDIRPWPGEGEPEWPQPDPDAVVLSGLRIANGGACPGGAGGGVNLIGASVHLLDCDIVDNRTGFYGGGIGAAFASKVIAQRCRINRNTRRGCGAVVSPAGVALLVGSLAAFRDCEISENQEPEGPAGVFVDHASQLFLRNCKVLDNYGACIDAPESNVFIEGSVLSGHPKAIHPPIEISYGRLVLRDSLVYANGYGGSVIVVFNTPTLIDGCVVAYNETGGQIPYSGGGHVLQPGPAPPFGYWAVDWTEDALPDCRW